MTKKRITSNYLDSLKAADREFGLVNKANTSRVNIFEVLDDKYRDYFVNFFLNTNIQDPSHFSWILVESKIKSLTEIVAYMVNRENPRGVGSLSNNGKIDATLRTINMYPKKKIQITPEAKFAYPEISAHVLKMKKLFKKQGHSFAYGEVKGAIVARLTSMAKTGHDYGNHLVKAISDLKQGNFNFQTKIDNQFKKALEKRMPSIDCQPGFAISYRKNDILENEFKQTEIINEFKELEKLSYYENVIYLKIFLKKVFYFIENESGLNLTIQKPFSIIERCMLEDLDSHEYYEYGSVKRVSVLNKRDIVTFKKSDYSDTLNGDFGIKRPFKFEKILLRKDEPIMLSVGRSTCHYKRSTIVI